MLSFCGKEKERGPAPRCDSVGQVPDCPYYPDPRNPFHRKPRVFRVAPLTGAVYPVVRCSHSGGILSAGAGIKRWFATKYGYY